MRKAVSDKSSRERLPQNDITELLQKYFWTRSDLKSSINSWFKAPFFKFAWLFCSGGYSAVGIRNSFFVLNELFS